MGASSDAAGEGGTSTNSRGSRGGQQQHQQEQQEQQPASQQCPKYARSIEYIPCCEYSSTGPLTRNIELMNRGSFFAKTFMKIGVGNGSQMLRRDKKRRNKIHAPSSSSNTRNRVVAVPRMDKKRAVKTTHKIAPISHPPVPRKMLWYPLSPVAAL